MLFLIEYNRRDGQITNLRSFIDSERYKAQDERLKTELEFNRKGIEREIVLLEAESEDALRRTHRRYFENIAELVESLA